MVSEDKRALHSHGTGYRLARKGKRGIMSAFMNWCRENGVSIDCHTWEIKRVGTDAVKDLVESNALMLNVLKMAYLKHVLSDDSIGWEELTAILCDALCNEMGDEEFNIWLQEIE